MAMLTGAHINHVTVQRLLASARFKVAQALVGRKALGYKGDPMLAGGRLSKTAGKII